ncbi:unnamed protein product [Cylicostephanus goldi]|uniref:Uncharacterized protein n=1 Tax=Cylicostephanus goldi TaxID=71465 RepID=A0A3P7MSE5_CYLGO|nr:unnamed protein product [Cylicostephanus goldi]
MIYLRAGHIPHLTWDVVQNWLKLDQTPIYQLTLPSLIESAKVIEKFGGAPAFCGMPNFLCDSFDTMLDYDTPKGSLNKRMTKAIERTKSFNDFIFREDGDNLEGAVLISLGGGFSDYHRRKCAVDGPLPPAKLRFVAGVFDPAMVLYLTKLGFDLFDSSYAVKMAEEVSFLSFSVLLKLVFLHMLARNNFF